jgi:Tfp pilus assembly protein PilF
MSRFSFKSSHACLLIAAATIGGLGFIWWLADRNDDVRFLPRMASAEWIMYPSALTPAMHPRPEFVTSFERKFVLDAPPRGAMLRIAGCRRWSVSINGASVSVPDEKAKSWKSPASVDVRKELRRGENEITISVFNTNGPPVLWAVLQADEFKLSSDEMWTCSYADAPWNHAIRARKPRLPEPGNMFIPSETPWPSFRAKYFILLMFAALSFTVYFACGWFGKRMKDAALKPHVAVPANVKPGSLKRMLGSIRNQGLTPVIVLIGLWIALFANNIRVLPPLTGFDVRSHLHYIGYLRSQGALPPANEEWETFQAPLYYLVSAGLLEFVPPEGPHRGAIAALRWLGAAIGIAHFLCVWASLRLLFPGDRPKALWGLFLAAAAAPVIYLAHYITNEALAAALVSANVYLTLRMLKADTISWKAVMGLGFCLGAALLGKATAFLAVPVVAGALLWRGIEKRQVAPTLAKVGVAVLLCFLVSGWHYVRLWKQFGTPFAATWDPRLGYSWWQDDGFATRDFFLRFGDTLTHPWFASLRSFAGGLYSTLWGDGALSGAAWVTERPPWNYELMAAGYLLALVPSLAAVAGGVLAIGKFIRQPSVEWFLVLGLAFLVLLAMVYFYLTCPYFSCVKAFYGLCGLTPLCAFAALGLDTVYRHIRKLGVIVFVLFALWAMNSYMSFWISRDDAPTSSGPIALPDAWRPEATRRLSTYVAQNPDNVSARCTFIELLMWAHDDEQAAKHVEILLQKNPPRPEAQLLLANALDHQGRIKEATEHARQAMQLAPAYSPAVAELATLLVKQKDFAGAAQLSVAGLSLDPFSNQLRLALGIAEFMQDNKIEGLKQISLAMKLNPKLMDSESAQPATGSDSIPAEVLTPELRIDLARILVEFGASAKAISYLRVALDIQPQNPQAHMQMAVALTGEHEISHAINEYREALRLDPGLVGALNNLAWLLATSVDDQVRDGREAVRLARRACELTEYREPVIIGTLAAAYAEAGEFDQAVETAKRAADLALSFGQTTLANRNQQLLQSYREHRPYRE